MANEQHRRRSGSLSQRRASSQFLEPLLIPRASGQEAVRWLHNGTHTALPENDVVEEGRELFQNFVVEQIEKESPNVLNDDVTSSIRTPVPFKNQLWQRTGRDLRRLADEFANTRERETVRAQAAGIHNDMTYEQFRDLLEALFEQGGITSERIVVLFYFCSDVAIRCLQSGADMFQRFVEWSLNFIVDRVCSLVQSQGGWSRVLSSPFNSFKKALFWGTLAVICVIGFRYWRNRT